MIVCFTLSHVLKITTWVSEQFVQVVDFSRNLKILIDSYYKTLSEFCDLHKNLRISWSLPRVI